MWQVTSGQTGQEIEFLKRSIPMMNSASHICISKIAKVSSIGMVSALVHGKTGLCHHSEIYVTYLIQAISHNTCSQWKRSFRSQSENTTMFEFGTPSWHQLWKTCILHKVPSMWKSLTVNNHRESILLTKLPTSRKNNYTRVKLWDVITYST